MFSISFRKHGAEKKENNLLTLIIKILFVRAIITSTARASSVSPSSYTNTIFNQSACVLFYYCFLIHCKHFYYSSIPNLVFNQCWHNKAMLKEFTLCMSTSKLHTTYLKPFIFFKGVYRLLDGAWGRR